MSSSLSSTKQAGNNIFMSSIGWLANLIAFIASFLGTPFVYGKTIGWIHRYTAMNYGGGYVDLITFVWWAICALLIFFIARASIGTALVMGGLAIAARFLV